MQVIHMEGIVFKSYYSLHMQVIPMNLSCENCLGNNFANWSN